MAIVKRPPAKKTNDSTSVDSFISSAPDAKKDEVKKRLTRGNRSQISHTLPPEMLAKIDELAQGRGMTRAGFINYAISELIAQSNA